jgi:hypothetical protein
VHVHDLTEAEHALIQAVAAGKELDLGSPDEPQHIRADLIRQLLTGDFAWPDGMRADPRGIRLHGAHLTGELDLTEVQSALQLILTDCHTTETIRLTGCRLSTVDITGLVGTNVVANEAYVGRSLLLTGCRLTCASPSGTINLAGAYVNGVFDAAGATVVNTDPEGPAVQANNIRTGGGIFLNRGFRAEGGGSLGTIRLSGAQIGGQLNMVDARIVNPAGPAVVADYLTTRSNVMLCRGFHATGNHRVGTVRIVGAEIGGRLMFDDGHAETTGEHVLVLNLARTHVAGGLLLPLSFTAGGLLSVAGLTYDGLIQGARLVENLDMLAKQTDRYHSQPYNQLAAAHKTAGHERNVRRVHIARQRDLLARGDLDFWGRVWLRTTGLIVGYGYRPATALLWWAGTLLLSVLLVAGIAGPAGLTAHVTGASGQCTVVEQVGLALNAATPLVKPDTQQNCQVSAGAGLGQAVIVGTWVLQVLAWAFVTLFVAGFTGLVRKE